MEIFMNWEILKLITKKKWRVKNDKSGTNKNGVKAK